jgi:hypothetical protein
MKRFVLNLNYMNGRGVKITLIPDFTVSVDSNGLLKQMLIILGVTLKTVIGLSGFPVGAS